jgi:pyrroline-5-carboxylate reductase
MEARKQMAIRGKFVVVGAGAMGGSLLRGWLRTRLLSPKQVVVVDLDPMKRTRLVKELKIKATDDAKKAVVGASFILLAVKPQQMKDMMVTLGAAIPPKALVITIVAGVSTAQVEKRLSNGSPVVRVMPNTPALLGAGMAGVAPGKRASAAHVKTVLRLFEAVGKSTAVPERLMDLVTAISGSGPAYYFRMIEALTTAGKKGGLSGDQARLLAAQTALGAARMVLETGKDPAELRVQVTSPGGTTQAGLAELDRLGFADSLEAAVKAATLRGAELRRMND